MANNEIKPADKKAAEKKPAKAQKPSRFHPLRYLKEVAGEVKKLSWPTFKDLLSRTGAVVAFVVAMAVLIGVLDLLFSQGIKLIALIGA